MSAGVFEDVGGVVKDVGRAADGVVNDIGKGIEKGATAYGNAVGCTIGDCTPFGAEEPRRSITYKDYKGTNGPPHPIKPLGKHPIEPAQPAGSIGQSNTGCVGTDGVYRNFPAKICAALDAQKKKADTATTYQHYQRGYVDYLKQQNEQLKAALEHKGARKDRGPCLDTGRPTRECKFAKHEQWETKRDAWASWRAEHRDERRERRAEKRAFIGCIIHNLSRNGFGF